MNLWVDCDDTLVIYDDAGEQTHPYGVHYGTPWTANEPLIAGIKAFRRIYPNALIVVWSGGGGKYAQEWVHRFFLPSDGVVAFGKNPQSSSLIKEDDIVVDDYVDFKCPAKVYGPHEWPEKEGL